MSFTTFKQQMNNYMTNQDGIGAYADFAKKITQEYDMCIKRGFQTVNSIPIAAGNTAGMEAMVITACIIAIFFIFRKSTLKFIQKYKDYLCEY